MDQIETRREFFIEICRRYGSLDHVRSKDLFLVYADKVEKNIYLSRKMLDHFITFFQRDNRKYSREELTDYFDFLLAPDIPQATLEPFFN